jgi:hypothetical protein
MSCGSSVTASACRALARCLDPQLARLQPHLGQPRDVLGSERRQVRIRQRLSAPQAERRIGVHGHLRPVAVAGGLARGGQFLLEPGEVQLAVAWRDQVAAWPGLDQVLACGPRARRSRIT